MRGCLQVGTDDAGEGCAPPLDVGVVGCGVGVFLAGDVGVQGLEAGGGCGGIWWECKEGGWGCLGCWWVWVRYVGWRCVGHISELCSQRCNSTRL